MTFRQWIFSIRPESDVYNGQWKFPHIITLCICLAIIVTLALVFRKKSSRTREAVVKPLAILVLIFEVALRAINFAKGSAVDVVSVLLLILPSTWSAIACWVLVIAAVINKKSLWNFSAINGLLCSALFFVYPTVGFVHKTIVFTDFYLIATHALLLIASVSILTLRLGDLRYKRETFIDGFLKELIAFGCVLVYVAALTVVLKALGREIDPMYFRANNALQTMLGLRYAVYLALYFVGLCIWINAFYLIPMIWKKYISKGKEEEGDTSSKAQKTGRYLKTKGEIQPKNGRNK